MLCWGCLENITLLEKIPKKHTNSNCWVYATSGGEFVLPVESLCTFTTACTTNVLLKKKDPKRHTYSNWRTCATDDWQVVRRVNFIWLCLRRILKRIRFENIPKQLFQLSLSKSRVSISPLSGFPCSFTYSYITNFLLKRIPQTTYELHLTNISNWRVTCCTADRRHHIFQKKRSI